MSAIPFFHINPRIMTDVDNQTFFAQGFFIVNCFNKTKAFNQYCKKSNYCILEVLKRF